MIPANRQIPEPILNLAMKVVSVLEDSGINDLVSIATALDSLQHFPGIDLKRANAIACTVYVALQGEGIISTAADNDFDLGAIWDDMLALGDLFTEALEVAQ